MASLFPSRKDMHCYRARRIARNKQKINASAKSFIMQRTIKEQTPLARHIAAALQICDEGATVSLHCAKFMGKVGWTVDHIYISRARHISPPVIKCFCLRHNNQSGCMNDTLNQSAPHPEEPTAPLSFIGHIDEIKDGTVIGWVQAENIDDPLTIDILIEGQRVVTGLVANVERPDVMAAGFDQACCGFAGTLPEALPDGTIIQDGTAVLVDIALASDGSSALSAMVAMHSAPDVVEVVPEQSAPAYACKARIESVSKSELRGWAVNTLNPAECFSVDILIDGVFFRTTRNEHSRSDLLRAGLSDGIGGIRAALPLADLGSGTYAVSLRMPDGQIETQTATIEGARRRSPRHGQTAPIMPQDTAIIVPVYNAYDDVENCINRLAAFTPGDVEILFIDDASPDGRIAELMERARRYPNMRVLRNETNLGFTRTVNRGLTEVGQKHAVLLNSDARVTPGWLEGMLTAASSRPRVATVTAMSDRAGAFSAPMIGNDNELPPGVDEVTYARAFRRRSMGLYPIVPTGNGFCMFVNRACINEIGALDEAAFPRGYGEENDFCMRAGRAGWSNLIDDRTYVFHDRSKSFGEAKTDLMTAGRAVIDARYPEYKTAIRAYSTDPDLGLARMQARLAQRDCAIPRETQPRLLFVVATQTGGTPQTNLDLMGALADGFDSWLMRCDSKHIFLMRREGDNFEEVARHELQERLEPIRHTSSEYDAVVAEWLRCYDFELVHIRHLAWHSLNLPRVAKAQGCTVVFSFHDFYALCPSIKLLRADGTFYGGDLEKLNGLALPELWPVESMPPVDAQWISYWRERFEQALAPCDAFVTTSESARDTILTYLPGISSECFHVIPHGRNFSELCYLRKRPRHGEPLRILVPGNISMAKGLGIIRDLLNEDKAGLIEFHVLGKIDSTRGISHPRLIVHGTYKRDEFAKRVKALNIHLGAVFSVWDETYCHTLTELWSVGIPPLVFDFPTVATRVRKSGAGWVLPHENIQDLYTQILTLAFDPIEQDRVDAAIAAWQDMTGSGETTQLMGGRYLNVYRQARGLKPAPIIAVTAPSERRLQRDNASTDVRVWERTRNGFERDAIFVRMAPDSLLANLHAKSIDGAIIQRNVIPATMVDPLIAAFKTAGVGYAVDLDDNLLDVPADKDPNGSYEAYAPYLRRLLTESRGITVSTPQLMTHLVDINKQIHLLPNRISEPLWRGYSEARQPDTIIRALYFGSVTHGEDLAMIHPALEHIAAQYPNFRLAVVGVHNDSLPEWAERIAVPAGAENYGYFVPWLREQAKDFDFAIAPLMDTQFNQHKSGLKVMEATALGLPVLASNVVSFQNMEAEIESLTLVDNDVHAWTAALEAALKQAKSNLSKRDAIKKSALQSFGLQKTLPQYDALILNILM